MFIHALTFAKSRESCLNTRLQDRALRLLPRDPANFNALKQTCVIVILAILVAILKFLSHLVFELNAPIVRKDKSGST